MSNLSSLGKVADRRARSLTNRISKILLLPSGDTMCIQILLLNYSSEVSSDILPISLHFSPMA